MEHMSLCPWLFGFSLEDSQDQLPCVAKEACDKRSSVKVSEALCYFYKGKCRERLWGQPPHITPQIL